MRKKKIWIGVLCCILAGCTGCQRQNETAGIVTEKGMTEAEKKEDKETEKQENGLQVTYETENREADETSASKETGEAADALAARLGISGGWSAEIDLGEGSSITADAEILLPNADKFPVYTVTNQPWEPEFVQQMGDALLGGETSWYDMGTYWSTPKEKRGELSVAKPEWKVWSEASTGILNCNNIVKNKNGDTFAVWADEQDWKNHEFFIQYLYKDGEMVSKSRNYEWSFDTSEEKQKSVEEGCEITEEEAVAYAEKCLQNFPIPGFHVTGTAYATRKGSFTGDGIEDTAYWLACERDLEDIPIACDYICGGAFEDMDAENSPWWSNELLILFVNDKGVVAAEAYNFYDIGEKTAEDVELLPFVEICDVFAAEKQADTQAVNLNQTFHVTKVRLGYFRVFDPGEGSLTGRLIPVWDFYGSWTQAEKEGEGSFESDRSYFSMCTINAMDGSVVNRHTGY